MCNLRTVLVSDAPELVPATASSVAAGSAAICGADDRRDDPWGACRANVDQSDGSAKVLGKVFILGVQTTEGAAQKK